MRSPPSARGMPGHGCLTMYADPTHADDAEGTSTLDQSQTRPEAGRTADMTTTTHEAAPEAVPTRPRTGITTLFVAGFVVYFLLLAWIVLWKLQIPWIGGDGRRIVKLVPFAPTGGAGASEPVEIVINFFLFVPLGLYLGLLAPAWKWWKAAGAVAGASLALEVAQYVLAVGSTDVTDLVTNTAGGLAGIGVLALARRRLRTRTATVMTRVCSLVTVFALVVSGLFVASPLRFAPPGNMGPCAPRSIPEDVVPADDSGTQPRAHGARPDRRACAEVP